MCNFSLFIVLQLETTAGSLINKMPNTLAVVVERRKRWEFMIYDAFTWCTLLDAGTSYNITDEILHVVWCGFNAGIFL